MKIIWPSLSAALLLALSLLFAIDSQLQGAAAAGRGPPAPAAENGTAGFFGATDSPTACFGKKKQGNLIGAADIRVFQHGKACGQKFEVTCIGAGKAGKPNPCKKRSKSVVIKIVDTCEPDPKNPCQTLSLSEQAFSAIADPDAGVAAISFKQVA